jgi:inner membrane transporter RhtA
MPDVLPKWTKEALCMSQVDPTSLSPSSVAVSRVTPSVIPPWGLVVIAVVSVQIGAAVAKQLFDTAGPTGVVLLRTVLAGLMFVLLLRPKLRRHRTRDYGYVLLYGINISWMMLCFYAAIDRIPLGIAVAVSFIGPLGIAVLGSRRVVDLLWVALAGVGILLLSPITNTNLDPVGMLLSLGSAIMWATYIVLSKQVNRRFESKEALTISMLIAAVATAPVGFSGAVKALTSPALILLSLVVAVLSSAIPFWFEYSALTRLTPRAFGLLVSLEPVMATLIGFVALHEALGWHEVVGIALVTIAVVATARSSA